MNDSVKDKRTMYAIRRHAWFAVFLLGTVGMIYVLYFPHDSVRSFMEDWVILIFPLLVLPPILIYHSFKLFKWWRGETMYLGILRVLKEMELERANTPKGENNPIFCANFNHKDGMQYDVVGYLGSNSHLRPEGMKVANFVQSRNGRFTHNQVKELTYLLGSDAVLFRHAEEGWWEYLPSKERLSDIISLVENRRETEYEYRYVED